jgi:hypothetical protein
MSLQAAAGDQGSSQPCQDLAGVWHTCAGPSPQPWSSCSRQVHFRLRDAPRQPGHLLCCPGGCSSNSSSCSRLAAVLRPDGLNSRYPCSACMVCQVWSQPWTGRPSQHVAQQAGCAAACFSSNDSSMHRVCASCRCIPTHPAATHLLLDLTMQLGPASSCLLSAHGPHSRSG